MGSDWILLYAVGLGADEGLQGLASGLLFVCLWVCFLNLPSQTSGQQNYLPEEILNFSEPDLSHIYLIIWSLRITYPE